MPERTETVTVEREDAAPREDLREVEDDADGDVYADLHDAVMARVSRRTEVAGVLAGLLVTLGVGGGLMLAGRPSLGGTVGMFGGLLAFLPQFLAQARFLGDRSPGEAWRFVSGQPEAALEFGLTPLLIASGMGVVAAIAGGTAGAVVVAVALAVAAPGLYVLTVHRRYVAGYLGGLLRRLAGQSPDGD